jgi:diguanylate cyclase (GGDEF)-like protein/PAS domain S-box-containing protein
VHVLVVEQDPDRERAHVAALRAAGLRYESVSSANAALVVLARPAQPDVVLYGVQTSDMDALDFLQAASGMGRLPPVILLGEDEQAAGWVESTRLGATDFIHTDSEGAYLQTLVGRIQATEDRRAARDHDARMADALSSTSAAVILAGARGTIEVMNEACAHMLGLSSEGAYEGSLEDLFPMEDEPRVRADLFTAVHAQREWAGEVRVQADSGERVDCLVTISPVRRANGRTDGLVLTLRDVSDRVAMEEALRAANRRLAEQASRDTLTGLYNRGYFHEVLERELARAVRYGDVLSVVMVDLDHFKEVNDVYGHAAGDLVLCAVAEMLRPGLRDGDVLGRYGGDEFCVLLPNTPAAAAQVVAERLCASVAGRGYGPGEESKILLSAGIATSEHLAAGEGELSDAILRLADRALYVSKRRGGNVVTIWTPELAED